MTDDEVLAFMRRWWDGVWRDGDLSLIDELVAERYVRHSASGTTTLSRSQFKEMMVQYQRVLHGPVTTIDDHAVDGDKCWVRATSRGVNLETGAPIAVTWMLVYRFQGGRLAEGWTATLTDVDWTS